MDENELVRAVPSRAVPPASVVSWIWRKGAVHEMVRDAFSQNGVVTYWACLRSFLRYGAAMPAYYEPNLLLAGQEDIGISPAAARVPLMCQNSPQVAMFK